MDCRGRPLFDLNEPPAEEQESEAVLRFQPQKALPTLNPNTSTLFASKERPLRIVNNNAFSHASSVSGFQPFIRAKNTDNPKEIPMMKADSSNPNDLVSSQAQNHEGKVKKATQLPASDVAVVQGTEREEGEWSDVEGTTEANKHDPTITDDGETTKGLSGTESTEISGSTSCRITIGEDVDADKEMKTLASVSEPLENAQSNNRNMDGIAKGDITGDGSEEHLVVAKPKEVRGIEASHALRVANNPTKKHKLDQHKEAMLGKKRSRQTMFLNLEDVKQASGSIKSSTPRRQASFPSIVTRTVKEVTRSTPAMAEHAGEKQGQSMTKDQRQGDPTGFEGNAFVEHSDLKAESNSDVHSRFKKLNSSNDVPGEGGQLPLPKLGSFKQPMDNRQLKNPAITSFRKPALTASQNSVDLKVGNKKLPPRKPNINNTQYQDTSVERLLREVTNDKFWNHPEETDLQCVPGRFESVEEYVRVFEPLLFEECRAQLYSNWEELTEITSRDVHIMVRVKSVERRERGWYDVVVLPAQDCKWMFKEGDVAILSSPKPGTVRYKKSNNTGASDDDLESEVTGRVAGTVRRHIPTDTRDPLGATLHFFVGDIYDSNSNIDEDHILRKFQVKSTWYLTVLGSLATTQREYIALHAFRRLNLQMQSAILKPSPEHFPKYEEQPPAMPECFTPNFTEHLHRTFNGPQLAAIQWAAMHTAAGTSSAVMNKRQDPWPFTLVQGPPGTGKTHTVWGMLNVIHLVQYQHYYNALLKKLAPESYKQNENNSECVSTGTGSIDEVLQSMDQNLFRTLPKLCPKPRMLVCAPSNAATDELLSRVLDRGFIDGEMKVYRPDVARVGVDSQTRAAQAVSVERRTEQLLVKGRDEIVAWMHQLKIREAQHSQQIAALQRELTIAAVAGRSQGSVGVDPEVLVARDHSRDTLLQNLAAVVEARDKVLVEMSRLLILESKFRASSNFNLEDARANLEASFANEAEIVFTTVSSSGRKLFSRLTHGFDMVVIDEAAQASEVAILPPLSLGAARCVLVGDPQQLPATVISKAAGTLLYSRSLFERFQQAGCPTMLLSVQYRMHPQIRDFPSRYFYQGRLTDSESVSNLADEIYYKDPLLRPYAFYDITHGRESHRGGSVSYQNIHEAQFAVRLYEQLQKTLKSTGANKVTVGIITPYKLQLKCLQREFEEVLNSDEGKDAFQGQERDVIIMSCVRASNHGVGFVADIRRMNVALTRAKRALWVVGNANALMQSDDWAALIADAKARNCFTDMDSIPKEMLILRGSNYSPLSGKVSNMRGLRAAGSRHRNLDMPPEPKSGTLSEEDDALISRNGSYRNTKGATDNLVDDMESTGERSRDSWQYDVSKRQNGYGILRRNLQ
ncbi:putative helicase MAGATAMA 3 [Acorus gramineus]|uniref:Helicase MAGATAMA 3 n=1 Tax=Acorus gramineus TaxID=55184 RepID=A0AAV9A7K3_ACOGR|nr:putative helicase MAGATAMA 3 [Acorus gramineus]